MVASGSCSILSHLAQGGAGLVLVVSVTIILILVELDHKEGFGVMFVLEMPINTFVLIVTNESVFSLELCHSD